MRPPLILNESDRLLYLLVARHDPHKVGNRSHRLFAILLLPYVLMDDTKVILLGEECFQGIPQSCLNALLVTLEPSLFLQPVDARLKRAVTPDEPCVFTPSFEQVVSTKRVAGASGQQDAFWLPVSQSTATETRFALPAKFVP